MHFTAMPVTSRASVYSPASTAGPQVDFSATAFLCRPCRKPARCSDRRFHQAFFRMTIQPQTNQTFEKGIVVVLRLSPSSLAVASKSLPEGTDRKCQIAAASAGGGSYPDWCFSGSTAIVGNCTERQNGVNSEKRCVAYRHSASSTSRFAFVSNPRLDKR